MKLLIEVEFSEDGSEAVAQVSGLEALLEAHRTVSYMTLEDTLDKVLELASLKLEAIPKHKH